MGELGSAYMKLTKKTKMAYCGLSDGMKRSIIADLMKGNWVIETDRKIILEVKIVWEKFEENTNLIPTNER